MANSNPASLFFYSFILGCVRLSGKSFKRMPTSQAPLRVLRQLDTMCAFVLLAVLLQCGGAFAQGFGGNKKTVTLQRKLPALIHLPGTAIDIRPVVRDQANGDVAQALSDLLLVTLQKNDTRLHVDKNAPDVAISYTIITYQTPPPTTFVRQETQLQNKHLVQVPVQYSKVSGELTIAYSVLDARRKALDAGSITQKYSQDFQVGTNQPAGESGGLNPFGVFTGKGGFTGKKDKKDENTGPPNPIELRQKLLDGAVSQFAPRLVNTQENVEVMLSRGKFDDANKLAEKGQWARYLESLETMTPLSSPGDDAYRLYNIGVANEALAYQAEDKASIQKFLDQAAINYGKAIDAKPSEKYFIDPQNRIQTAVAHYKKLSEGANTKGETVTTENTSGTAAGNSTAGPAVRKPTGPSLANADVIKMAKAGVDEDSIIASIQDASAVNFDLSPDGLIALAKNGVKGKIVSAMRARAKQTQRHSTSPSSN